jgi:hypothetical protein
MTVLAATLSVFFMAFAAALQWVLWLVGKRSFAKRSLPVPAWMKIYMIAALVGIEAIIAYECWTNLR